MRYFMPDYAGGGDPKGPSGPKGSTNVTSTVGVSPGSTGKYSDDLDVRDVIASVLGRNDRDLTNKEAQKDYHSLVVTMGAPMAQKLMNHLLVFNQRTDQQGKPFEKRLSSLYDIGSNDKDVDHLLKYTNTLGEGPIAGARSSVNLGVMSAEKNPVATSMLGNSMAKR